MALLKNGANKDMQDSKVSPRPWLTRGSSLAQTSPYPVAESGVGGVGKWEHSPSLQPAFRGGNWAQEAPTVDQKRKCVAVAM